VQLFQAVTPLAAIYVAQARLDRAAEAADVIGRLMTAMPLPAFVFAGNLLLGIIQFHSGHLATAQDHFERVLATGDVPLPAMSGDMHVYATDYLAITLLHRGLADQARARNQQAFRRAAEVGRPFDRAVALQFDCFLHALLRDLVGLRRAADEGFALAAEYDMAGLRAIALASRGRALVADGKHEAGAATIAEGIAAYRASGQRIALPTLLGWHIEAHIDDGNLAAAQPLLGEAFAHVSATSDLRYLAELHRLQGLVHRLQGDRDRAEQCFRDAIDLARDQGARWWELRATTSLAQLLPRSPRSAAHDALAALVATLSEGGDTIDVRQARALLS
jgi:tetratricopeptide (TPR) repeat protein